jgi:putative membrane protein
MVDARDCVAHTAAAWIDDVRQAPAIGSALHAKKTRGPMFSQAALNATLNGTSGILLAAGYVAIRTGKRETHKKFMISAFVVSCAFLVSYLNYHYRVGDVKFQGHGWIRPVYFTILISHIILAAVIVPMVLVTLRRAWLEKFDKHKLIARWTLPLWFYVCVTGVIVYLMVYQIYAPGHG